MIELLTIIISIPIVTIIIIKEIAKEEKNKEKEDWEVPIEEESYSPNELRLIVEQCENEINERNEFKRNVDIRQFKDREDVTVEEVINYLIAHHKNEGFIKMCIRTELIAEKCNLNEDDVAEIRTYMYKHMSYNSDKEQEIIDKYNDDETWQKIKYNRKFLNEADEYEKKLGIKRESQYKENEFINMKYNYEEWLKEKGYV